MEELITIDELTLLKERVCTLEKAIRNHRDQKADDRCWLDDQELYAILKDGNLGDNTVGSKEEMLKNCSRYLDKRCSGGDWLSYAQLEEKARRVDVNWKLVEELFGPEENWPKSSLGKCPVK